MEGIADYGGICCCCRGSKKSAGGFKWEYDKYATSTLEEAKAQALKDIAKYKEQQPKEKIIKPYKETLNPYFELNHDRLVKAERQKLFDGGIFIEINTSNSKMKYYDES